MKSNKSCPLVSHSIHFKGVEKLHQSKSLSILEVFTLKDEFRLSFNFQLKSEQSFSCSAYVVENEMSMNVKVQFLSSYGNLQMSPTYFHFIASHAELSNKFEVSFVPKKSSSCSFVAFHSFRVQIKSFRFSEL